MVDRGYLEDTLTRLLRTPTGVPPGETEIGPGHALIVGAVRDVVRPIVEALKPRELRQDEHANIVAEFGPRPENGVLLFVYVVSQHANEMADPTSGRIVDGQPYGLEGRCAVGQGATQNKGAMAAVFSALRALPEQLRTGVTLAVNTEGRSSHGGSTALLRGLHARGACGIVSIGTDLRISVGNRGRVDVRIGVEGASAHSSQPWLGINPIPPAADVVARLSRVPLPEPHPALGAAALVPYQFRCEPVAPHTIPRRVEVVADRRILPGEDPAAVVENVRAVVPDADEVAIHVEAGTMMWPALVNPEHPVVLGLVEGARLAGRDGETFYSLNAFDAGYPCRQGIPTVMFGPGRRRFSGSGILAEDVVRLEDCGIAAGAVLHAILRWDREHG